MNAIHLQAASQRASQRHSPEVRPKSGAGPSFAASEKPGEITTHRRAARRQEGKQSQQWAYGWVGLETAAEQGGVGFRKGRSK
jgi:hypothetical protein